MSHFVSLSLYSNKGQAYDESKQYEGTRYLPGCESQSTGTDALHEDSVWCRLPPQYRGQYGEDTMVSYKEAVYDRLLRVLLL